MTQTHTTYRFGTLRAHACAIRKRSVRSSPQTSMFKLLILLLALTPRNRSVFFGYFRSSRPFTGSATTALPAHVIRGRYSGLTRASCLTVSCAVSLPDFKRPRFPALPDNVMTKIAAGVTELADSKLPTEAWRDNLRVSVYCLYLSGRS